jgi:hypothetical protein
MIPIARDLSGNTIVISSEGPDQGHIYYWERHRETAPAPIARSLRDFMYSLQEDTSNSVGRPTESHADTERLAPEGLTFSKSGRSLNRQHVARVERQLGRTFPTELVSFYLLFNGGIPNRTHFFIGRAGGSEIREFFTIGSRSTRRTLQQAFVDHRDILLPRMIPIAEDVGDNKILISAEGPDRGRVYFWDHEKMGIAHDKPNDPQAWETAVRPIADSLREFLHDLREESGEGASPSERAAMHRATKRLQQKLAVQRAARKAAKKQSGSMDRKRTGAAKRDAQEPKRVNKAGHHSIAKAGTKRPRLKTKKPR